MNKPIVPGKNIVDPRTILLHRLYKVPAIAKLLDIPYHHALQLVKADVIECSHHGKQYDAFGHAILIYMASSLLRSKRVYEATISNNNAIIEELRLKNNRLTKRVLTPEPELVLNKQHELFKR